MKVFVTDSDGYIGARLVPVLFGHGLEGVGFDTGYYRDGWPFSDNRRRTSVGACTIHKDLRDLSEADLEGCVQSCS
jgi:nucleoside-diphosphate-sugar epimerase